MATVTTTEATREYAVFRIGSNSYNQPYTAVALVAFVEARSEAAACKTRVSLPGTIYHSLELVGAPGVEAYNNQYFVARPVRGKTISFGGERWNVADAKVELSYA